MREQSLHPRRSQLNHPGSINTVLLRLDSLLTAVQNKLFCVLRGQGDQDAPEEVALRLGVAVPIRWDVLGELGKLNRLSPNTLDADLRPDLISINGEARLYLLK